MGNIFEINDLYLQYSSAKGFSGENEKIYALNGVDLAIREGEIFAIAGESGCGKSTLARVLMGLEKFNRGKVLFNGKDFSEFSSLDWREFRQKVQMVFQNPYASLNPKMKIFNILDEVLVVNTKLSSAERRKVILEKITQVGLDDSVLEKYPHEFSGGQRQRIAIARALVLNPVCLIADEPVSALDVSIQAQIINLLNELKDKYNLTIIFISHDLRVVKYLADRVAVMYLGEIVELANSEKLFSSPKHPYTKALLSAVPTFEDDFGKNEVYSLKGDLPSANSLPQGCLFHTRCSQVMDVCRLNHPIIDMPDSESCVRCWLYHQM